MKILFKLLPYKNDDDSNILLGIGGYKHHKDNPWTGYTLIIRFFFWQLNIDYISDHEAYKNRFRTNGQRMDAYKKRVAGKNWRNGGFRK